jgi:hypothetical protein
MNNKEQKSVEYYLLLSFSIVVALYFFIRYMVPNLLLVWFVSSPSVGPYVNEKEYASISNMYYFPLSELYVEETIIEDFAPMMLQLSYRNPEIGSLDKPSGLLLVDLPSKGGLAHPKYRGELSEDILSFFQKEYLGHHLSMIVLVQTPDSLLTTSWFYTSGFPVSNLPEEQSDIKNLDELSSLHIRYPNAEIYIYPELYGGIYHLDEKGDWEICLPFKSEKGFIRGSVLNKLKKKHFPAMLKKSGCDSGEPFGYSTN